MQTVWAMLFAYQTCCVCKAESGMVTASTGDDDVPRLQTRSAGDHLQPAHRGCDKNRHLERGRDAVRNAVLLLPI